MQPTPYTVTYNFAEDEADQVAGRSTVKTTEIDTELANIAVTLAGVLVNMAILQRDDTKLKDGIVEPHTLSSATLALLSSSAFEALGPWVTLTVYAVGDVVSESAKSYLCMVAHTAGTFATDLAAGKWVIIGTSSVAASGVAFTPAGTIAAATVQAAVEEAAGEAAQKTANGADFANIVTTRANLGVAIANKGGVLLGNAASAIVEKAIGADGDVLTPSSGATGGATWIGGAFGIVNGSLVASTAGNVLTIALKNDAGSDPSDDEPVFIDFRSATAGTGSVVRRKVVAALSLAISSGSTLGFTASETARIRIGAVDNAGTPELCAWRSVVGTAPSLSIYSPIEGAVVTTTAEGGAGAADTAGVLYSTTARANVAFRHLGFIDIQTGATPGEWGSNPTVIQLQEPGLPLPGALIQSRRTEYSAVATGTTVTPGDDTIPQVGEGIEFMSQAITPIFATSILDLSASARVAHSAGGFMSYHVHKDAAANAIAVNGNATSAASYTGGSVTTRLLSGSTSAITFTTRIGCATAGTTTFNGVGGARLHGTLSKSFCFVNELMT